MAKKIKVPQERRYDVGENWHNLTTTTGNNLID